jgi:hypothetical protein
VMASMSRPFCAICGLGQTLSGGGVLI